jgi:hypothetical protein
VVVIFDPQDVERNGLWVSGDDWLNNSNSVESGFNL